MLNLDGGTEVFSAHLKNSQNKKLGQQKQKQNKTGGLFTLGSSQFLNTGKVAEEGEENQTLAPVRPFRNKAKGQQCAVKHVSLPLQSRREALSPGGTGGCSLQRPVLGTHGVLLAVLTQHLRGDPAFSAGHPRAAAEAVSAHCQLLAEAEVGDHGLDPAVRIGHGEEDVVGLQVSVN